MTNDKIQNPNKIQNLNYQTYYLGFVIRNLFNICHLKFGFLAINSY